MNIVPKLQSLIAEVGNRLELEELSFDDEGFTALRFDEDLVVNFQAVSDDALMLYADLGVPARGDAIYPDLLKANLFWRTTMGATLSLTDDPKPRVILAIEFLWQNLEIAELTTRLESFVNAVEDWGELVNKDTGQSEAPDREGSNLSSDPGDPESMIRV